MVAVSNPSSHYRAAGMVVALPFGEASPASVLTAHPARALVWEWSARGRDPAGPTVDVENSSFLMNRTGQVMPVNPAHAVRGPKHTQRRGKTPALHADEARALIDAIDTDSLPGLRARALHRNAELQADKLIADARQIIESIKARHEHDD